MPTLATGRCKNLARRAAAAGFTLIEVLVVMVILGLLAVTVNLTLPDPARQEREDAAAAWRRQAELSARLADSRATAMAWEIRGGRARILEKRGQQWLPLQPTAAMPGQQVSGLPEGMQVQRLEIDGLGGETNNTEGRRIVFVPGEPPLFRLWLAGAGQSWRLEGLPNGRIDLRRESAD